VPGLAAGDGEGEVGEALALCNGKGADASGGAFEEIAGCGGDAVAGSGKVAWSEEQRAARLDVAQALRVPADSGFSLALDIVEDGAGLVECLWVQAPPPGRRLLV
jgi:hypothetical protein